jgi:hypothetical protein
MNGATGGMNGATRVLREPRSWAGAGRTSAGRLKAAQTPYRSSPRTRHVFCGGNPRWWRRVRARPAATRYRQVATRSDRGDGLAAGVCAHSPHVTRRLLRLDWRRRARTSARHFRYVDHKPRNRAQRGGRGRGRRCARSRDACYRKDAAGKRRAPLVLGAFWVVCIRRTQPARPGLCDLRHPAGTGRSPAHWPASKGDDILVRRRPCLGSRRASNDVRGERRDLGDER